MKFKVKGMSCTSCSTRIEKKISSLNEVSNCNVNLLTNIMEVDTSLEAQKIIDEVDKLGYQAQLIDDEIKEVKEQEKKNNKLKYRLISSIVLLLILMYISMGHMMLNFPLPSFISESPILIGIIQFVLTTIVIFINFKFYINGVKSIIKWSLNMDTLIFIGSFSSYLYSTIIVILMIMENDSSNSFHMLHNLYFESAAMILTLITLGKTLEEKAKGKTTNSLKDLMKLSPKNANVIRGGKVVNVLSENVSVNELFVVKPGEIIPFDGKVVKGITSIDESTLTGESMPKDKEIGDDVFEGSINLYGYIECQVTKEKSNSTLAQIIKIVNDVSMSKAPINRIADKVSSIFVPVVVGISFLTFGIWLVVNKDVSYALSRMVSVLLISCPCSLGLATPVAIMVGSGVGAKNGILFKNATSLEINGKINHIFLDKTGTITLGEPHIVDIVPWKVSQEELLENALSLEKHSEHPLAKAIVKYGEEHHIKSFDFESFKTVIGRGIIGKIDKDVIVGGNLKLIKEYIVLPSEIEETIETLAKDGKTPLFFSRNHEFLGIIAISDKIKEDSKEAIKEMKKMGMKVYMLTGDNEKTSRAISSLVGIDQVYYELLPQDKERIIKEAQKKNKVIMVGDGINDALSLTTADVGISLGSGTDIAINSSDVVIMKNQLMDVVKSIKLSKKVLTTIYENLFWAFSYNLIGIPLATGILHNILGWDLNPMIASLLMSFSSILVVLNALRINSFKSESKMSEEIVVKQLTIEKMMCEHCQKRVEKLLLQIPNVIEVKVSYQDKMAIVKAKKELDEKLIAKLLKENNYILVEVK